MTRLGRSLARFSVPASGLLVTLAVLVALGVPAGAAPPQSFPSGVDVVRVDAVVLDRDGKPVKGLTAADFEVDENGKRRAVASFETIDIREPASAEPTPISAPEADSAPRVLLPEEGRAILIYFDDIHVQPDRTPTWVRPDLGPFLARELRPGDVGDDRRPDGKASGGRPARRGSTRSCRRSSTGCTGQYVPDPFGDAYSDWLVMQQRRVRQRAPTSLRSRPEPPSQPGGSGSLFEGASCPPWPRAERYGIALLRIQRTLNGLQRAIESLDGFRGRKSVVIYSEGFILSPAATPTTSGPSTCAAARTWRCS